MKLPVMSRKEHEQIVANMVKNQRSRINEIYHQHEKALHQRHVDLCRVVDKMVKVSLTHMIDDYATWRIVVEFCAERVTSALEHGGDEAMLEMIGDEVKYKTINRLRSMNIQRPEKLGLVR